MSEENNKIQGMPESAACSPIDCASCTSNCSSNPNLGGNTPSTITLTMEDDTEVDCAILTVFPVDKKEYIALLPLDSQGQSAGGEVFLYAFSRTEQGDPILANIEDEAEYSAATQAFDRILENARKEEAAGVPLDEE